MTHDPNLNENLTEQTDPANKPQHDRERPQEEQQDPSRKRPAHDGGEVDDEDELEPGAERRAS